MTSFSQIWSDFVSLISVKEVTMLSAIFKLCFSLLLGSIVGLERKRKGQSAGIRTFALISMGATLAMLISIYVPQVYLGLKNGDPGRIAAQVVSGIGFLGAGAIIQMKGSVKGLTTAAGIWMVAAIGLAVGVGLYTLSIVATALILFILVPLERFEHRIGMGSESRIIRIKVGCVVEDIDCYRKIFKQHKVHLNNVFVEYDYAEDITRINFVVLMKENTDNVSLFADLRKLFPTQSISLANQVNL
ncbi:MAG: MgtC/SapB family protein [Muribaculaceae bacterium]|nr:MgtC/SapB family protein [Muribaculaceae bacterium]